MRWVCLLVSCLVAASPLAQDAPKKKKPAAKKQVVHKKPTPEQIRKFNQLQKKQQRDAKG